MPQMLISHCASEINQPKYTALWEIARIGQEARIKKSIQKSNNYWIQGKIYCGRMGAKMTTQGREDNNLGGVPPKVRYAHWVNLP